MSYTRERIVYTRLTYTQEPRSIPYIYLQEAILNQIKRFHYIF